MSLNSITMTLGINNIRNDSVNFALCLPLKKAGSSSTATFLALYLFCIYRYLLT